MRPEAETLMREPSTLTRIDITRRCERCREQSASYDLTIQLEVRAGASWKVDDAGAILRLSVCAECWQEAMKAMVDGKAR